MYSRIWDSFELRIYIHLSCKINVYASFCINPDILEDNLAANHYLNQVCFVYPALQIKELVISNHYLLPIDILFISSLGDIADFDAYLGFV